MDTEQITLDTETVQIGEILAAHDAGAVLQPPSRTRMMRKTYVASQQRELLGTALERLLVSLAVGDRKAITADTASARVNLAESKRLGRVFENSRALPANGA